MRHEFSRLCNMAHRIVCSAVEPSQWHPWNAARGCMWRAVAGARARSPPLVCFEDRLSKLLAYALHYRSFCLYLYGYRISFHHH